MLARLPHGGVILDAASHAPRYGPEHFVTDYWSTGFGENARKVAAERAAPHVGDENLLGYFLDNELFWVPDWRTDRTLLQLYAAFPADAPGRVEALRFARDAAVDVAAFNATWGTNLDDWQGLDTLAPDDLAPATAAAAAVTEAFAVHAFDTYAGIAIAALKEVDPDHLVLGCRFAAYPGDALVRAAAAQFDVISMAGYRETPPADLIDPVWSAGLDRPFLIEEFSFKADDSGLVNVKNYAPVVGTQHERGLAFDAYVGAFASRPYAVAYHWYKWFDNPEKDADPVAGDNFGLMNWHDKPYKPLVDMAAAVNRASTRWHASGAVSPAGTARPAR
jgi:agarase